MQTAIRETTRVAARKIQPHVGRIAGEVYRFILARASKGATCAEVEKALELSHQTASARIRELALKGMVYDSGHRRRTPANRPAIVWFANSENTKATNGNAVKRPVAAKPSPKEMRAALQQLRALMRNAKRDKKAVGSELVRLERWLSKVSDD